MKRDFIRSRIVWKEILKSTGISENPRISIRSELDIYKSMISKALIAPAAKPQRAITKGIKNDFLVKFDSQGDELSLFGAHASISKLKREMAIGLFNFADDEEVEEEDTSINACRFRNISFRTRSETKLARLLFENSIQFFYEPSTPFRCDDRSHRKPDFLVIARGKIVRVELDGKEYHDDKPDQIEIDRRIDIQFTAIGVQTLRYRSSDVFFKSEYVIRTILQALLNSA